MNEPVESPVSEKEYDFRPERAAGMDAGQIEVELANIMSGNPRHPYVNERDHRHDAATAYALALHERKLALTPQRDGQEDIDQMKAEKRQQAEQLRTQLVGLGFARFDVPDEVQEHDLDALRRQVLIRRGQFLQVLPELRSEIRRLGDTANAENREFLTVIERAASQTDNELSPSLKQMATDAAFALNRIVHDKRSDHYQAVKAKVDEDIRRDREARS